MPDIAVIGGGIIGLLTARELAAAGAEVALIERGRTGREASWAGGGILLPLYPWRQAAAISALVEQSLSLYPQLAAELRENTGIDPEHTVSGLLIARTPDIDRAVDWCSAYGVRAEQPPPERLRELAPNIRVETDRPLWLPDVAHIRNPRLLQALRADLVARGVALLENREVTGLAVGSGKIEGIRTSTEAISANSVVLCTGAWSALYWKTLLPDLDIVPVKGQMLLFDAEPGILTPMVLGDDHYLIPRRDGKILCGSSVEHSRFDKSTTQEVRVLLQRFALETLPALRDYPLARHWAGLRPGTPSGIPYIDIHPEIENLAICCGHFRNGLVMGPASAKLTADLLLKRQPEVAPEPYAIGASH